MALDLKMIPHPKVMLSAHQQKLQALIAQIEQQKQSLADWGNAQHNIQSAIHLKLMPIYAQLHMVWYQQLDALWQHLHTEPFSKAETAQLDSKLIQITQKLKKSQQLGIEKMQLIHKVDQFYTQHQRHQQGHQHKNVEQTNEKITMGQDSASISPTQEWHTDEYDEWAHDHQQLREAAKQKRQQEKREQAEKLAEQSLKTVYLKITAMIHPDREQDEIRKAEKTELLQVVNQAHESQDLFYLLKLQLQLEQNKGLNAKELSKEQLKLYKLALEGQSQKLESQIAEIIEGFYISTPVRCEADIYKAIDADVLSLKQQVKAEKERLKYMERVSGLAMLMEHGVL